ncbi:hypothetical protein ACOQFV_27235 [Nocardiopsis changdeensis]|uniref:Uncharacterized protein n=1 Tax=Nocardiopsis changdeensis TaxID=2831969 RepID=A0ABX8BQG9_9ACTN|nr:MULTISPECIES: hypothetical protein [Nocardiopsis]QUX22963.1 hypothetical protein KGD84_00695 [Nocardiopsis changdeensis]QYX38906.1 hypothetical protein K1J57_10145 [Nocardiopsis sp. MT53]
MRFQLDLWMDEQQEARYRADRTLRPEDDVRPDTATRVLEEVDGLGQLNGWWHAEIRTR